MSKPKLLFLDEPTSNLDSFQAQSMIEALKILANTGRLVLAVIHQPRSSIFAMFDNLLLLSEGRTMYFGPANQAINYFTSLSYQCPMHFNPADYFLDIVSLDTRSHESETVTKTAIEYFATQWQNRCLYSTLKTLPLSISDETLYDVDLGPFGRMESKLQDNILDTHNSIQKSVLTNKTINDKEGRTLNDSVYMWLLSFYLLSSRANAGIL